MAIKNGQVERVQHSLQLSEELKLHETGWVVQRVGWALMLLFVVAGALGVFGNGYLSQVRPSASGMKMEFDRFLRYETETRLVLESSATPVTTLAFPQQYLKKFRVVRFVPEPVHNQSTAAGLMYHFQGGQHQIISVYLIPKEYGAVKGSLTVNGNVTFQLSHFTYP